MQSFLPHFHNNDLSLDHALLSSVSVNMSEGIEEPRDKPQARRFSYVDSIQVTLGLGYEAGMESSTSQ